ncbi:MAG: ribose-phosphate diphosphokinase [Thermoplasmata archaeon]|nr:ribose-phosphate diphosphokinase [Thermoplasmata archaeon]
MIVVGGTASKMITRAILDMPGFETANIEIIRYPDSECYVRVHDDLTGQDVVLIQNSYPDENFVELLLLQDAIKNAGASTLVTVIPYFGYARQDKMFEDWEAVSARVMAKSISMNSDKVFTIDIHNTGVMSYFDTKAENLTAMKDIGQHLKESGVDAILSPDEGSKERARIAAESAGLTWDFLEKTRLDGATVEIKPKSLDVQGKCVAIVDDIIATGGTIINSAEQLRTHGAAKIIAACTHGLFTGGAIERLTGACDMVVSTDTIERPTSKISAASAVAEAISGGE